MREGLPKRLTALGALVAAVLAAGISQAGAQTNQSCGWLFRLSGDQVNAAFPDEAILSVSFDRAP